MGVVVSTCCQPRSPAWRWVPAAALLAGCDLLIGADFDDAHPRTEGATSASGAGGAQAAASSSSSSSSDLASATTGGAGGDGGQGAGGIDASGGGGWGEGGSGGGGRGGDGGAGGVGEGGVGEGGQSCEPGIEDGDLPGDENCDGLSGEHVFSWNAGFGFDDRADGVVRHPSGDILVVGRFQGSIDLGGGALIARGNASDIFVARLTELGGHVWSRRFGSAASDVPAGVALAPDGDVLVAATVQAPMDFGGPTLDPGDQLLFDVALAKLSADGGEHVWSRIDGVPSTSERVYAIAADASGNVAVGGRALGAIEFVEGQPHDSTETDAFVAKIDGGGAAVWSVAFGGSGEDVIASLAFDPDGHLWLVGTLRGSVDLGGGVIGAAGVTNVVLAKLDRDDGSHLFSVALGQGENYAGADVVALSSGDVLVTAGISGTVDLGGGSLPAAGGRDVVVAQLASDGAHVWSRRFGDVRDQDGGALAPAAGGGAFLGLELLGGLALGYGVAPIAGPRSDSGADVDAVLVRLSTTGEPLWARSFGASGKQQIRELAAEPTGGVFVAAQSAGSTSWGGDVLTPVGASDAVVARFGP